MRKQWDLKNIKKLLKSLGNPEKKLKVVHVTGTNGKGSTTAMIASILNEAGYRTGRYVSPHIDDFRERITIDGRLIPREDIVNIFKKMKNSISSFKKNELSFFEITTAIAYVYFANKNVDYAVLETGLGGRLDATNVAKSIASVITNVDVEHVNYLGNTVKKIAKEKAGIVKRNSVLVTAEIKKEVLEVLKNDCTRKNSRMIVVGKDVTYEKVFSNDKKNIFRISGSKKYAARLRLLGEYQGKNAAVAVAVAEELGIDKKSIEDGLKNAWLPARLEIIEKRPLIVMDSAHNPAAMENLSSALRMFSYRRLILVIGLMKDKDIHGIMSIIGMLADVVIVNRPAVYRAADPKIIANCAMRFCNKVIIEQDVRKSVKLAKSIAEDGDLILITGSMYMLSEARDINSMRIAQ